MSLRNYGNRVALEPIEKVHGPPRTFILDVPLVLSLGHFSSVRLFFVWLRQTPYTAELN